LFPSSVFWSAGIMKGAITNAAVVVLSGYTLKIFYSKRFYLIDFFFVMLSLLTLFYIKYYLLIAVIPVMIYAIFDRKAHKAGISKKIRGWTCVLIFIATLISGPHIKNLQSVP